MCGIAGYIVTDPTLVSTKGLWSMSRCLLTGIQSRGRDAAGYAYIMAKGNTNFAKFPIEARDFIKIPGHLLYESPTEMPTNMLLHARYATVGEPSNNKNNHPLYSKVTGLCMIHNGWFVNDGEIKEQFSLKPDAEVDTEVYLRLIEKFYIEGDVKSIEVAIKEATKCMYGALACGMIQGGKHGTMWLWRDRGDLFVIQTEWGFVFASTAQILINAIGCLPAFDLAYWKRLYIPPSTLVKFETNKKPKFVQLETIDLADHKYASTVFTTVINGEEKVRRVKKVDGNTTTSYYYGGIHGYTPSNNSVHHGTYFNGYSSNKGYSVQGTNIEDAGVTNNGTQKATDSKEPKKPKSHHVQCRCKTCSEWWEYKVANGEMS
jgi:asparagine synthetase B (glutamine-hydrolysing)